jgi:hypothetical protein
LGKWTSCACGREDEGEDGDVVVLAELLGGGGDEFGGMSGDGGYGEVEDQDR